MGVHDVEWHLHGVKVEFAGAGFIEHAQVNERIFVAGEADETDLARLLCFQHGFHGAAFGENAVGVFQTDHFVELHQVDVIGLETLERLVDLAGGFRFGAAVDFGHEEDFVAITVGEGLAHADFTDAAVIVPAVVHEGDAAVDGLADELDGFIFAEAGLADVEAAEADGGDTFAGAAEGPIDHAACGFGFQQLVGGGCSSGHRCGLEKVSPVHDASCSLWV